MTPTATPDFRPTHVVPQDGMPAWEAPGPGPAHRAARPAAAGPARRAARRLGACRCAPTAGRRGSTARLLVAVPQDPPAAGTAPRPHGRSASAAGPRRGGAGPVPARGGGAGRGRPRRGDVPRAVPQGLRVGMVVDGESVWLYDAEHERWVYCDGTRLSTYAASRDAESRRPRHPPGAELAPGRPEDRARRRRRGPAGGRSRRRDAARPAQLPPTEPPTRASRLEPTRLPGPDRPPTRRGWSEQPEAPARDRPEAQPGAVAPAGRAAGPGATRRGVSAGRHAPAPTRSVMAGDRPARGPTGRGHARHVRARAAGRSPGTGWSARSAAAAWPSSTGRRTCGWTARSRSSCSPPNSPATTPSGSGSPTSRGWPPRSTTRTSCRSSRPARPTACCTSPCGTSPGRTCARCSTARARCRSRRPLRIAAQVASALDAAHDHDLVHRDVKPGNILVAAGTDSDHPEHVYLTDFGLTKKSLSLTGFTTVGQFVGTLDYVAPEQISGRPVDGRCDVYSLACVVYETLAGVPPFQPGRRHGAAVGPPVRPAAAADRGSGPNSRPPADEVLAKALAKSPDDRYDSCLQFVAALRAAAHGPAADDQPADAGGTPTACMAARPGGRNRPPPPPRWACAGLPSGA